MPRRHVVITGTGRCGTTFLVELLTELGLDTGYSSMTIEKRKSKIARAGLESDIRKPDAPFIVKNPSFCDYAEEVLSRADIQIEHIFIPMRDLKAAAESRRVVTNEATAHMPFLKRFHFQLRPKHIAGGLTTHEEQQADELLHKLYQLLLAVARTTVPVTLMRYPLIIQDSEYLFEKLQPILGAMSYGEFDSAFGRIVRQDLVHSYTENDR